MALDKRFHEYFAALDRSGNEDRCYLCRRSPADVKAFFGFDEDGLPFDADEFGIEDVVLEKLDIMSYRALRPVCAVCQLNYDAIFMMNDHATVQRLLKQMEEQRDELWPAEDRAQDTSADPPPES